MPQISINGSANITSFGYTLTVDIAARTMTFNIAPYTSGSGLVNTKVAFSVVDSVGLILATINFAAPQIPNPSTTTSWVLDLSGSPYPFLFQQYNIIAAIQDQGGIVYQTQNITPTICEPVGFNDNGYVPGLFCIESDCVNSILTIKEVTLLVYNGLQPISVTPSGVLSYPTGTIAAVSFGVTPFTNNVVYTGQYNITCTTVAQYYLGNDVYVNVSYYTNNIFNVTCKNKMADLLCCIYDVQQTAIKHCNDATGKAAQQKLRDIGTYFFSGYVAESTGRDSSFEYEYIKKTLNCNCGSNAPSQSQFTPINPAVNSIVLVGRGGTSIPSPVITGNTQTYYITSSVYQVVKGVPGDPAFTITLNTATPNVVQYIITFNYDAMASEILTAIAADPSLIAQFNALVQQAANSLLGLNGQCVIDLTHVDYTLQQTATIATMVVNVVINGATYNAPSGLLALDAAAFTTWLNTLSLGTFAVNAMGGIVTVISMNNTNVCATMTFSSPNITVAFQAFNATLVQVLQAIINYICNLSALEVLLGNNLSLCTFDYNGNIIITTYDSDDSQNTYNAAIAQAICNIVGRINTLTGLTCAKLQAIFADAPNAVFDINNDRILSIVGGNCTTLTAQQFALAVISAINAFTNVKDAYCAINCSTPVSCPEVANNNVGVLSTTSLGVYGVTWSATPTASQTVTVRYRIHGTLNWLIATNALGIFPNGNLTGASPFTIAGLTPGTTYDIWITNNCGGNGFVSQATTPSSTLYSGAYLLDNIIYNICGDSPTTLYSRVPFGVGVTLYIDSGTTTPVTGYSFVCQTSTGNIYFLNSATGVVGANTGSPPCSSGTAGTYILGNTSGPSICSGSPTTYYTNGAFAVGGILYVDSALTTPVTGSSFVVQQSTGMIFNLNSATGAIGAATGTSCSGNTVNITSDMAGCQLTNVIGITGFTPSPALPLNTGGTVVGTHGAFTGTIQFVITGNPVINPSNIELNVNNGAYVQCINVTGPGTYTFTSHTYMASDIMQFSLNTGGC